uniref:Uncharacterized protein n=1 Tax=Lotus japonicus TaxID=34305 RepID=I3SSD3_LOTJA|nr:unknown [Lotus japonicus]
MASITKSFATTSEIETCLVNPHHIPRSSRKTQIITNLPTVSDPPTTNRA